jgi:hypothetical protein
MMLTSGRNNFTPFISCLRIYFHHIDRRHLTGNEAFSIPQGWRWKKEAKKHFFTTFLSGWRWERWVWVAFLAFSLIFFFFSLHIDWQTGIESDAWCEAALWGRVRCRHWFRCHELLSITSGFKSDFLHAAAVLLWLARVHAERWGVGLSISQSA